jgi:hypothetical protein
VPCNPAPHSTKLGVVIKQIKLVPCAAADGDRSSSSQGSLVESRTSGKRTTSSGSCDGVALTESDAHLYKVPCNPAPHSTELGVVIKQIKLVPCAAADGDRSSSSQGSCVESRTSGKRTTSSGSCDGAALTESDAHLYKVPCNPAPHSTKLGVVIKQIKLVPCAAADGDRSSSSQWRFASCGFSYVPNTALAAKCQRGLLRVCRVLATCTCARRRRGS